MRLFWKVFFTLMLTLLITVAVSSWLSQKWLMENSAVETRLANLSGLGEVAISLYQQEGKRKYQRWLKSAMKRQHFRGFLINAHGNNILNRRVPAELKRLAKQAKIQQKRMSAIHPPTLLVATPVLTEGGEYYWLAVARLASSQMQKGQQTLFFMRVFIMLFALTIISWWLTRMLTRPIRALQEQTEQLGLGKLSSRTDAKLTQRKDELGDLARSFNAMAEQLQALMQSHKQLLRDISHELRSPLARLQVALELARNASGGKAGFELDRIDKEASKLNELIGEVLTLARFEQGGIQKNISTLQLHELVSNVAADAVFEAESMGKKVLCSKLQKCSLTADKLWLTRAIDNVIRNAVRHSNKTVKLSLTCDQEQALITIIDDGEGVEALLLPDLFEPFFRVSHARERPSHSTSPGYGLGLAIAKRAIELHGGNIRACNHPTGGLEVRILLYLRSTKEAF